MDPKPSGDPREVLWEQAQTLMTQDEWAVLALAIDEYAAAQQALDEAVGEMIGVIARIEDHLRRIRSDDGLS